MRISILFVLLLIANSFLYPKAAAKLEVKLNYVSTQKKVIVGSTTNADERVELLVSLLDNDGNYATEDKNGNFLSSIAIESDFADDAFNTLVITPTHSLERALEEDRNIARYVLDYSDVAVSSVLQDTLVITAGGLTVRKTILLSSQDAQGLIVRAAPLSDFENNNYINRDFAQITLSDEATDYNLSQPSSRAPGGSTNREIPIIVYASTLQPTSANLDAPMEGKFTVAPNLEDAHIMVTAVGDFNLSGTARTIIEQKRFKMVGGIAKGNFVITNALPAAARNISTFEPSITGGLPIAFIAHAENNVTINNRWNLDPDNITTFEMTGDNNATDTIKMHSADPSDIKVGRYLPDGGNANDIPYLDRLWDDTGTTLHIVNGASTGFLDDGTADTNGSKDDNVTVTIVDKYGNPAFISDANLPGAATIEFKGDPASENFIYESNSSTVDPSDGGRANEWVRMEDSNLSIYAEFKIADRDANLSTTETMTLDYRKGVLASSTVQRLTLRHLPLIENEESGLNALEEYISTTTGQGLLLASATSSDITENDLRVKIAGTGTVSSNISLKIYREDENDFLNTSQLGSIFCVERNATSATTHERIVATDLTDDRDDGYLIGVGADTNITIRAVDSSDAANGCQSSTIYGGMLFSDYNASIIDTGSITVQFRAFAGKKVSSYVDVSILDCDRCDNNDNFNPGKELSFEFSGDAIASGDEVEIIFNRGDTINSDAEYLVGLSSQNFDRDRLSNIIETTMPSSKEVRIKMYDTNATGLDYNISSIRVNNAAISYRTLEDDRDTDNIFELSEADSRTISIVPYEEDGAGIIEISATSASEGLGNEEGTDEDDLVELGALVDRALKNTNIKYESEVKTSTYYHLFGNDSTDLNIYDFYENELDLRDSKNDGDFIYRNFDLKLTTGGVDGEVVRSRSSSSSDTWVKFDDTASGTTQIVNVYFRDKPEVNFDIEFTNIVHSSPQNTKFTLSMDVGNQNFNIINTEAVIKVIGDAGKSQDSTTFTVTHSDSAAKILFVSATPSAGRYYDSEIDSSGGTLTTSIDPEGNYFIVGSDKPGTITIKADATIDSRDSVTKDDEDITGQMTVRFVDVDVVNPTLDPITDITISIGKITVRITDANLDDSRTTVRLYTPNNEFIKEATFSNGAYVFDGLATGTYRVEVFAYDFSGNQFNGTYVKTLTGTIIDDGGTIVEPPDDPLQGDLMTAILAHGTYTISGLFFPHDFVGQPSHFDFAYYDYATAKTFQFRGKASTNDNLFGFTEVELANPIINDSASFYMIQLTGAQGSADEQGKFGWIILRKSTLTRVSKIVGVSSTGTFSYDELSLKGILRSNRTISFERK